MKKSIFIVVLVAIVIASGVLINKNYQTEVATSEIAQVKKYKLPKAARLAKGLEWRYNKLINPDKGYFDVSDLYAAIKRADYLKNVSAKSGVLNLNWELLGPDNQGGRTRALIFDNQIPNQLWAGSVGGGLFKSTDNGNNWSRVISYDGFFAIASMTQGSDGAIYVGTGEGLGNPLSVSGASGFSSQSAGNGIFKSTDNGATWYQLESTDDLNNTGYVSGTCDWCGVNALAVSPINPSLVLAGTEGGLKISTNGGEGPAAFVDATGAAANGQIQAITMAEDGQTAFIVVTGRVYRSLDVASNFQNGWTLMAPTGGRRADVAIAPSNPNYVYVSVSATNNCMSGIWRSKDGGDNWTEIVEGGAPYTADPFNQPSAGFNSCQGQGWYDHTLAVNPADENKIYVGGISLYTWGQGYGFKRADLIDTELGGGDPFSPKYIHADKHKIIFDPQDPTGNRMLIGSDGGVTLCTNANSGFPDNLVYIQKNKGYATLQIYGMGAGAAGEVMSGNQDNGTQYIDGLGSSPQAAQEVSGGDGIYAEISNYDPDVMFGGVYNGLINRSINRGASTAPFVDENIDQADCGKITCAPATQTCDAIEDAPFIYPFYLLETSSIDVANQDTTAALSARNDTLLLATGATQIITDTLYPTHSVTTFTTISESGTTDSSYVVQNPQYQAVSKISDKILIDVTLSSTITPGQTKYFKDPYDAKYFVTSDCNLWMCINPLQKNEEPVFYKVSQSNSGINAFDASGDGDHLFYAAGSRLYRVTGLNNIHQTIDPDGCFNTSCTQGGLTVTAIPIPGATTIEGIAVDKNDPNTVLVTSVGFNAVGKVFRVTNATTNAPSVTPLQVTDATLPFMPVYDCIIDKANPDRYILATELGIWTSNDAGLTWSEDNDGLFGRMPIYRLRQEWLYTEECMVVYAGTHGGGMFRTTTLTEGSCYTTPYEWKRVDDDFVTINEIPQNPILNVKLYPNAVTTTANLEFELNSKTQISVRVVSLTGQLLLNKNYGELSGSQKIDFNASSYANGNYFAVITSNGKVLATKQFVKK